MMRIFATGFSHGFDGPGRRWVVYLKGCNLKCRWCANPESISYSPEILYYPNRAAVSPKICRFGAISADGKLNRTLCEKCTEYSCTHVWKHSSFELVGEDVLPQWVLEQAVQYKPLFVADGGVTFGGGEPTLQMEELLATLKLLRVNGIHTAIETNATSGDFESLINAVDWLICDLKCLSSEKHSAWTGMGNEVILRNIRTAAVKRQQLVVRIPFVEGFNDDAAERKSMADFLSGIASDGLNVEIMRMHHIGKCKYEALGLDYPMHNTGEPDIIAAEDFVEELKLRGLNAVLA
jgi:pyruvate formate lyase activating enzyme